MIRYFLLAVGLLAPVAVADDNRAEDKSALPDTVEFNRDIRPILSENCYKCHGPDSKTRQAKLRFDTKEGLFAPLDEGKRSVVPGNLPKSELWKRITTTDKDDHMPPAKSGKKLSPREVALLRKWIEQGAVWQGHWAFIPVAKPAVPAVKKAAWVRNPIDAYILARLEKEGLQPSADADPVTLMRRLSFDLTGLPPSVEDVDAFVKNPAAEYEKVVDRLLASPHYGERMALFWLDLVRFADSRGYHSDNPRNVSPYRDYVIQSFNENLPYDRFTIEQLAGDLLPESTLKQKVASGYNKLNLTTEEGGAQAREYEAKTAADRVRNASGVWMGATMGCCECHDHKFDPFSTKDFYRFAAFFADIKEGAIGDGDKGIVVPSDAQACGAEEARGRDRRAEEDAGDADPGARRGAGGLGAQGPAARALDRHRPRVSEGEGRQRVHRRGRRLGRDDVQGGGQGHLYGRDQSSLHESDGAASRSAGLADAARGRARPRSQRQLCAVDVSRRRRATLPSCCIVRSPITRRTRSRSRPRSTTRRRRAGRSCPRPGRTTSRSTSSARPSARRRASRWPVSLDFRSAHDGHCLGRFRLSVTADGAPAAGVTVSSKIRAILATDAAKRSDVQKTELATYYRTLAPLLDKTRAELADAEKKTEDYQKSLRRCLVTAATSPRQVRVLPRGNWLDATGEIVTPGVPQFLRALETGERRATRLDLAQWLVARDNPLTARVFVNRLWKILFGTGISKRLDDLGAQGEWPGHPGAARLAGRRADGGRLEREERGEADRDVVRLPSGLEALESPARARSL